MKNKIAINKKTEEKVDYLIWKGKGNYHLLGAWVSLHLSDELTTYFRINTKGKLQLKRGKSYRNVPQECVILRDSKKQYSFISEENFKKQFN